MPTHLFLIRHGESAWNAEGRLQGQADPPLSPAGRGEALALRATVARFDLAGVISSDLIRSTETAALAGHAGVPTDARWRERGLGAWTGELEADVDPDDLASFRHFDLVPPEGEAWPDFQTRVGEAVDELTDVGGAWLVFTHGGCVRAAVAHVTGADAETIAGPANSSVTLLELEPRRRLLAFNWSAHPGVPRANEPGGGTIAVGGQAGRSQE